MKTLAHNSFIYALRKPMALFMLFCLLHGQFAWALDPTGTSGVTQSGNGLGGTDTTVNLNQSGTILQWNNLSTANVDTLTFSGTPTAVLNRVHDAVIFNGDLFAAGKRVYIVSPNGIQIGPDAVIQAAKFVASGLNISNTNFAYGNDVFVPFQVGDGMTVIGQVRNDGTIIASGNPDTFPEGTPADVYLLGSKVLNKGTILSDGGLVVMATTTGAAGSIVIGDGSDIAVQVFAPTGDGVNIAGLGDGDVVNTGSVSSLGGQIVLAAGDTFAQALENLNPATLSSDTEAKLAEVGARQPNITLAGEGNGELHQSGTLTTGPDAGRISMHGSESATITAGSVTVTDDLAIGAGGNVDIRESLTSGSDMTVVAASDDVDTQAGVTLNPGKDLTVVSGKIINLREDTETQNGNIILDSNKMISLGGDLTSSGTLLLSTDQIADSAMDPQGFAVTTGNIEAQGDVTLETSVGLVAAADQSIVSEDGTVTADGFILKSSNGYELNISAGGEDESGKSVILHGAFIENQGNVYIAGKGDIELPGSEDSYISGAGEATYGVYADAICESEGNPGFGGVSIRSEEGRIYSEGSPSIDNLILGYSNDTPEGPGAGVDLPYLNEQGESQGKAAIVLESRGDLLVGPDATLIAGGQYDPSVDDRAGVNFLADDGVTIGDYERNEGIASDVAMYLGSTTGDVSVATDPIIEYDWYFMYDGEGRYEMDPTATLVFDAMDTVTLGFLNDILDNGYEGMAPYRIEVSSRRTEWLFQAIANGTLPFAANPEAVEALLGEGNYVLRGAGQDNPAISGTGETRAWVLEDPQDEVLPVVPLPALEIPELKGCPVEMDAAASELAMNSDDLQLLIGNSLATNPNLQPCKSCQKLVTASAILNDADGARMAAMNEIFNTLAPIDAPFTPEVSASVATAFANLSTDDPQYAQKMMAKEYIDAFVNYVAVVGTELQVPVGDPVAFALEKHGSAMTGSENPNIAAYVMAQIEAGAI